MKRTVTLAIAAMLCVALVALADEAKKSGTDEKKASGTISRIDMEARTLTVASADGKTWSISWTDSTKVLGGELKEGETVSLGYVESDGRMWASWIRVGGAKS